MSKDCLTYGQLAGTKTLIMSESSFLEKISTYVAEKKRKTDLESEVTNMVFEATSDELHTIGPGEYFIPKPPDEQVPVEQMIQKLDAIFDKEPLGFEKDPMA